MIHQVMVHLLLLLHVHVLLVQYQLRVHSSLMTVVSQGCPPSLARLHIQKHLSSQCRHPGSRHGDPRRVTRCHQDVILQSCRARHCCLSSFQY